MTKQPQSKYMDRILKLQDARKESFGRGKNIERLWKQADHDYEPHLLSGGTGGKKVLAKDQDKGWASQYVEIGADNWQSDVATANPYIKINTALSILVAKNPSVNLSPDSKKYQANTLLHKELYKKSWEIAKSIQQVKLFTFNLAKYGWACARTYPFQRSMSSKVATSFDKDNNYLAGSDYKKKKADEFNGVYRENLDPWMTWIDDKSKPNQPMSTRDWAYAKWIPYDLLKKEFGNAKNWKYVEKGASASPTTEQPDAKKHVTENMKLVYFYENLDEDIFTVITDSIPIFEEPLPIADDDSRKYLSLWHTHWTLRHAEDPFGIGIPEAMRGDKQTFDKLKNMTIDQIILSIYKMFFYAGTDQLDAEGNIKISPGKGKQVTDPKNVKFLEVPGPGQDAYNGIEMMQNAIDEASAVTKPLTGQEIGKTAYEAAQASEFSLRRLQTPLDNITDALEQDAELTIVINNMIYSIPEMVKLTDKELIQRYYEEIQGDMSLYGRDEAGNFEAYIYPEVQMNLDTDEEGQLIEAEDQRFFHIHPRGLPWRGIITIQGQSIMVETKVLQKAQVMDLLNVITPLLEWPKELALKPIKQVCKKYEVDWKEWVPDEWVRPQKKQQQDLFVPQGQAQQMSQGGQTLTGQQPNSTSKNLVNMTQGRMGGAGLVTGR